MDRLIWDGRGVVSPSKSTHSLVAIPTNPRHKEFEQQALPHMDVLYNYALRLTGSTEDAKDLIQETYLKAYRFWDKFEQGTNLRAWLFRIMKNTYINIYRKEVKEPDKVDYDEIESYYNIIRAESARYDTANGCIRLA